MLMWFSDARGRPPLLPTLIIAAVVFTILADLLPIVVSDKGSEHQIDRSIQRRKKRKTQTEIAAPVLLYSLHFTVVSDGCFCTDE
jgi:hypothetical protein